MHTCMESGMDDEWLGEWMHACIHIWIDACMHAHTGRYVYVQVNMKTDGWTPFGDARVSCAIPELQSKGGNHQKYVLHYSYDTLRIRS